MSLTNVTNELKIRRTIQYLGLDFKQACSFAKGKNARAVKRKPWDYGEKTERSVRLGTDGRKMRSSFFASNALLASEVRANFTKSLSYCFPD